MKTLIPLLGLLVSSFTALRADMSHDANNFYSSDQLTVQKVTFENQYQMKVAGNLFIPKNLDRNTSTQRLLSGIRWAR
jgi:hypothetical protein